MWLFSRYDWPPYHGPHGSGLTASAPPSMGSISPAPSERYPRWSGRRSLLGSETLLAEHLRPVFEAQCLLWVTSGPFAMRKLCSLVGLIGAHLSSRPT